MYKLMRLINLYCLQPELSEKMLNRRPQSIASVVPAILNYVLFFSFQSKQTLVENGLAGFARLVLFLASLVQLCAAGLSVHSYYHQYGATDIKTKLIMV